MKKGLEEPFQVAVANCQTRLPVQTDRLRKAVLLVLRGEHVPRAEVSIAVVDDPSIHELNRQHLDHDYPTDVLSFALSDPTEPLEAEIILSCDTAERSALDYGWSTSDEMCLYVIHGVLHVIGYEDESDDERHMMRSKETHYLNQLGVQRSETDRDGP